MPADSPRQLLFVLRVQLQRLVGYIRGGWYRAVRLPLGYLAWTLWTRCDWIPDWILSRRNALARLGDLTLLRAPPALAEHYVADADVRRKFFIWSGDWDQRTVPLEQNPRHRLMHDIWNHRDRIEGSASYRDLLRRIETGRPWEIANKGQRLATPASALAFCHSQLALLQSLQRDGFQPGLAPDELKVAIGRGGEIIKANSGRKRFTAARILGMKQIPLRIAYIHRDWLQLHRRQAGDRAGAVRAALQAVQDRVAALEHDRPAED